MHIESKATRFAEIDPEELCFFLNRNVLNKSTDHAGLSHPVDFAEKYEGYQDCGSWSLTIWCFTTDLKKILFG